MQLKFDIFVIEELERRGNAISHSKRNCKVVIEGPILGVSPYLVFLEHKNDLELT